MWIKPKNPDDIDKIVTALRQWLEESRFTAAVYGKFHSRWKHAIRVERVRKRAKEIYCGQHPNECVANPFFDRKERKGRWLEGSDWVGFNDGLNDVLDGLEVEADVWSYNREALKAGRYFIRKGRCRRVDYDSECVSNGYRYVFGWSLEGTFEDWIGHEAPRADYPEGTPGRADWRPEPISAEGSR